MVLSCICNDSLKEHSKYLGGRKQLPIRPPTTPMREDVIFAALRRAILNPKARYASKNAWIWETMWKLVDNRFSARQDPAKYQSLVWRLGCAISAILKGNRRQREEEAGVEVEALLGSDSPIHREAWCQIKVCYRYAVDHAPPPDWVTLKKITEERVGLYV